MFFEMRFDLSTLDSGERSLPFGLLVTCTIEEINNKGADQTAHIQRLIWIFIDHLWHKTDFLMMVPDAPAWTGVRLM